MALIVSTSDLAIVYAAGFRYGHSVSAETAVDKFLAKLTELNNGERPHIGDPVDAWTFMKPGQAREKTDG